MGLHWRMAYSFSLSSVAFKSSVHLYNTRQSQCWGECINCVKQFLGEHGLTLANVNLNLKKLIGTSHPDSLTLTVDYEVYSQFN